MLTLLIAVLIVLLISALCSGSEAALFSIDLVRVKQLQAERRRGAKTLALIKENMTRPIAAIVIINNLANIVGSIVVGAIATDELGSNWLGLFSGVLTLLVIVFSEIIPKTLGEQFCEFISLAVAVPVRLIAKLLLPLIWFIELITAPITRGRSTTTTDEAQIRLLAKIGQKEGVIEEDESQMIQRIFQMNDKTAAQIMTPRTVMTYLHGDDLVGEKVREIRDSQHSRIVVIGENRDDVLGIAMKRDLLGGLLDKKDKEPIRNFVVHVESVPWSQPSDDLLRLFQNSRQHIAIVRGEFGGVKGVVTLEDVLEVITGEIVDETDEVTDLQELARQRAARKIS